MEMGISAKKWVMVFLMSFFLACNALCQSNDTGTPSPEIEAKNDERWRVTVFNFEALDIEERNLGIKAREWLKVRLQQSGRLNLVDPGEATKIIGRRGWYARPH